MTYRRAHALARERGFELRGNADDGYTLFRLVPGGKDFVHSFRNLTGRKGTWSLKGISLVMDEHSTWDRQEKEMAKRAKETGGDPPVVGVPAVVVDAERTEGLTEIDRTYGYGLIYDRDRLAAEVPQIMGQAVLEAGRRLILLKEHEPHGEWLSLLERIGINRSTAANMMRAARKFIGSPNVELVHHLDSITKVYELARLDDDDLAELRDGGTIAGATLDDIQRMSPSELRAALRAERKERTEREAAQRGRLAKKGQEIDDLQELLQGARRKLDEYRLGAVAWSEREANIMIAVSHAEQDAINVCARVRKAIELLDRLASEDGWAESAKGPNRPSAAEVVRIVREQVTRIIDHLGAEATEIGEIISMPLPCEQPAWDPADDAAGAGGAE